MTSIERSLVTADQIRAFLRGLPLDSLDIPDWTASTILLNDMLESVDISGNRLSLCWHTRNGSCSLNITNIKPGIGEPKPRTTFALDADYLGSEFHLTGEDVINISFGDKKDRKILIKGEATVVAIAPGRELIISGRNLNAVYPIA